MRRGWTRPSFMRGGYPVVYEWKYILSHDVVESDKNSPFINIHGRIHRHKKNNPCCVNVSVEMTGYKPVPLEEITPAEQCGIYF
jgi:calcineurin-like phosphoesterase family protein